MPKVTSKLQLTVPKAIADQYGIRPGDELQWIPAGESFPGMTLTCGPTPSTTACLRFSPRILSTGAGTAACE
jgi:AbrB family looped-hinge helix DNA binding protein